MKRSTTMLAVAMLVVFTIPTAAQDVVIEISTNCQTLGKVPRYYLVATQEDKIPTFKYLMVPEKTECITGKAEHKIAGAQKPLDTLKDAMAVVNAVRDLVRTGFTDPDDVKKVIEYVADVEKQNAARPKKKIADTKDDVSFPWSEPKKK